MKVKNSIHELWDFACNLVDLQAAEYGLERIGMDQDYADGPKVLKTETEEILPGFVITKREMFHAPGDWYYEVEINDGDPRRFGLLVEMHDYLKDVSGHITRRLNPFPEVTSNVR